MQGERQLSDFGVPECLPNLWGQLRTRRCVYSSETRQNQGALGTERCGQVNVTRIVLVSYRAQRR